VNSLNDLVRVYDNALAPEICERLLALWHRHAALQQRNGASVRKELAHSEWTELDLARSGDATLSQLLSRQVQEAYQRYNREAGLSLPISPPRKTDRWILKRYQAHTDGAKAEQFQPHFDSVGSACNRYLVLLWYLNDVTSGGATRFLDLDLAITPRAGRLLMFPPYWMFQHAGEPPESGDKYILSTYLTY